MSDQRGVLVAQRLAARGRALQVSESKDKEPKPKTDSPRLPYMGEQAVRARLWVQR